MKCLNTFLLSGSSQGGPEAAGSYDAKPRTGKAADHDVPPGRDGQDPAQRVCGREETGTHHGGGLQQNDCQLSLCLYPRLVHVKCITWMHVTDKETTENLQTCPMFRILVS